jgi:sodium pump decarboxylase gamma subunit
MSPITLATSITPSTDAGFTATVVIAGIGIVLVTLIVLILVFTAFGSIVSKAESAAKKKAEKKAQNNKVEEKPSVAPVKAPAPVATPAPVVEEGISGEVVAAISAAVCATEGSSAVICSIRKKNPITSRNPWAQSAVIENTKPF